MLRSVILARAARPAVTRVVRRLQSTAPSYTERMNATGRPVSPHVTIYAFPAIAISSITVRVTGVMLCAGTTAVAGVALLSGPSSVSSAVQCVADSSMAPLAKFAVAWPLAYHFCGAIRHAVWDIKALGFTNQHMLMSSYAVFGAGTVIALALATTTLPLNEKKKQK